MKKVLIVIDMQKDFVDGALANREAQAIVGDIASLVENFDGEVIATRDTHEKNYLSTTEGKHLPIPHCIKNTNGWQIVDEIATALQKKNAVILDKPTFGFLGWECLHGANEIVMVGTCTDICVVSNALIIKALHPDIPLFVRGNLCAGTTKENHKAALDVMSCCQIQII